MKFEFYSETFSLHEPFVIAYQVMEAADVVVVRLVDGDVCGWGESAPTERYGETVESVLQQLGSIAERMASGMSREELLSCLPPGAARNAVDCALWDLEAKRSGRSVWQMAGVEQPETLEFAKTIGIGSPAEMGAIARENAHRSLFKIKLGRPDGDMDRVRAIRSEVPSARLFVDVNEGWTFDQLTAYAPVLADMGVVLIEQPLKAGEDDALLEYESPVPLCADESFHDRSSLPSVAGKYRFVNIKLDKTGGLTEALHLARAAQAQGFDLMVGCMVGTSLAMAPGFVIGAQCKVVDLDGPVFLREDRAAPIRYSGNAMYPFVTDLWG